MEDKVFWIGCWEMYLGLKWRSNRGVEETRCVYSHRKSRILDWLVNVVSIRERRHACKILMGKPEGKRPLGRSSHRCEDNIKIDLQEIRGGVNLDDLA